MTIKGFETYGNTDEFNTLVIEFQDGKLTCIHPAFLKEMQSSSFGKESLIQIDEKDSEGAATEEVTKQTAAPVEVQKGKGTSQTS